MARNSQEGLEVVQPEFHPVLHDNNATKYPIEYPEPTYYDKSRTDAVSAKQRWFRRKPCIILGIVLVLLILAAVIGGAVGATASHRAESRKGPTPTDIPPNTNTPGPLPTVASQTSICHSGVCPRILTTVTWPTASFVFGLSSNRSLVYSSWNGNNWNSTWTDLGGTFIFPPTIASWGPRRLDALGVQTDKALYWRSFSHGAWNSTWTSLGGEWQTGPSAVCRDTGFIDAYGTGLDGALWHVWATPAAADVDQSVWSGPEYLGGGLLGPPSVASWGPTRQDVFVRGTDNVLYQKSWDSGLWSGWVGHGGVLTAEPVVVSSGNNVLDIFVLGTQGGFCWLGWRNAWLSWVCPGDGKVFESVPAPLVLGQNRIDVVLLANDDHAYHKSLVGAVWSTTWDDLGGPLNGAPQTASLGANEASVFGLGLNEQIYMANWSSSGFSWEGNTSWISLGGNFESTI